MAKTSGSKNILLVGEAATPLESAAARRTVTRENFMVGVLGFDVGRVCRSGLLEEMTWLVDSNYI